MKRLTSILALLAMMMGLSTSVKAQQTWDFTQTPKSDVAALEAATSEWSFDTDKNRYENKNEIKGAIKAGGTELSMTQGLTVEAAAKKIRIDVDSRLQLAGKNIPLTTPSLKKGQVVTIVFASTGDNAVTLDALTNLSGTSGFTAADKNTTQTGTGTVTADGVVSFKSTGGSINVLSIKVEGEGEQGGDGESGDENISTYAVAPNSNVNQAVLRLKDQSVKYYNTAALDDISFTTDGVRVTPSGIDGFDLYKNVMTISFNKADNSGQGNIDNPEGAVQITEAKGWLESAYVKFQKMDNAKSYNVYVKGGQYNSYTKIDQQLVRDYGNYGRADVVGLMAGTYDIKVVAVNANNEEVAETASEATGLEVRNYNRDGYAHYNTNEGIGAYNNDGTLKQGARVIYVTKNNAKTIELSMNTGNKNGEEVRVGIQDILQAYEKGVETRPLAIRIIGQLKKADMPELGSSAIGLQVKGKSQQMNITIEGIGNDATFHGFGVLCRNCQFVELRNFAVMMHPEDGISFDTDNYHIWGHHLDIFYGENKGGDKSKGDGSFDVKGTFYATVSDNHFWDSGKCNLNSNGDEVDYVTYHHNWYDHSDSRHPRVRKSKHLHVYNNYYDGNSKYGIGATTGSCIFSENNYFRNCKNPMLISMQGTDTKMGTDEKDAPTFSKEDGGIIKAFGNIMTGSYTFVPYSETNSVHFDAYQATSRNEQVPANVVTYHGGTGYNNFDTASDFYSYTPDAADNVPTVVTSHHGAGRCEKGDFQWVFNNDTEDRNYAVINELSNALKNYQSTLVGIFGDENENPGGDDQPGGGDDPEIPEGTILASFDGQPSQSMFTCANNYGDGKITYNGVYYKKGQKMDSKGSITFTPTKNYNMTIILATAKDGRDVKLNGENTTVSGTTNTEGAYYEMEPIAVTAGTQYTLTKGSKESIVMLIKLEPIE